MSPYVSLNGLKTRRPASLRRSRRINQVPRFPRYYQGAMTSRRSSRRARFLRTAIPTQSARSFRPRTAEAPPREDSLGVVSPGISGRLWSVETAGSPAFLGNPHCALAPLFDPGRTEHLALAMRRRGPRCVHRRRLPHSNFELNSHGLALAVYASQAGLPDATQDSLPAVGQISDGLDYPQGSIERFLDVPTSILLSQA